MPARRRGGPRADAHRHAAQGIHGLEAGLVGRVVADEHGLPIAPGRTCAEKPDGAALVPVRGREFQHAVALDEFEAIADVARERAHLPRERQLVLGRLAVVQRRAELLRLEQAAGMFPGR